jgi:hypothetical protein
MLFKKGWGSTDFKRCFIIKSYGPDTSFLVGLTTFHVVSPSCLRFVARVASGAGEACVSPVHFVAMSPELISRSCVAISWAPPVAPFLMVQSSQFPQL